MTAAELAKQLLEHPDAECMIIVSHSPYTILPVTGTSYGPNQNDIIIHK